MFFDKDTSVDNVINYINSNPNFTLLVVQDAIEIKELLISEIKRTINNIEEKFIALKLIEVKEQYQRRGIFKKIISTLEKTNRSVMIDDIINDDVLNFAENNGYSKFEYLKNNEIITSAFKRQEI